MVPSLFICHGAPSLAIEDNEYTRFLQELGERFNPKAIVLFTAHWESDIPILSYRDSAYETIYDFGGFPPELYQIKYPAKGSTAVASMIEKKLNDHGISTAKDTQRGLDHGSWVVLRHMYPAADIPVVQVSINPYLSPRDQFKIGEALRGLGNEDILVISSGGTSHNLRAIHWGQTHAEPWTAEFDDWLIEHIQNRDLESLFDYERLAPHARLAVPRAEHFLPLFIAMGSGEETKQPKCLHRSYLYGTLSHIVFEF
ncbi:dioxygenase family protein [Ammoniphilus resinae]|uniref:4,5-DOPA dioxygenase extradiol n=1 Tax=Ammoniphilus resinae TaxID=861532 RepID=A0ABS4GPM7_9BACL|nr:class III extradiol ring-cleavage dioxygenase [Ammoniphilus resinae]MBP1932222.1 4,5-DOPA dioxygenase extradiol [Ammoniphilus resinae]